MGYFGLFLLSTGESSLLPIPSEIILPFAGYLVYVGQMTFWLAVLVGFLGQFSGSIIAYYLGYYAGRPVVLNYGKYFLLSRKHFEHIENWINEHKHSEFIFFFSRLLPVVRTVISFIAGATKVPFKKFLFYSSLGIIPWTVILVYIGFKLGDTWQTIIKAFDEFQLVVIAGIVVFLIWWVWKENHENQASS